MSIKDNVSAFYTPKALLLIMGFVLFFQCTTRDGDIQGRLNVLDPESEIYVPGPDNRSIVFDSLWSGFNFQNSTGTISCSLKTRAFSYDIFTANGKDTFTLIKQGSSSVFNIDNISLDQSAIKYKANITLRNGDSFTDTGYFTIPSGPPPRTPQNFLARGSLTGIDISWEASPDTCTYQIYRQDSTGQPFALYKAGIPAATIKYTDTVKNNSVYQYKLAARNKFGVLTCTTIVSAQKLVNLTPPGGINISKGLYENQIRLSWKKSINAAAYSIMRSVSKNGVFTELNTTESTGYTDTLSSVTVLYYQIASLDNYGRPGLPSTVDSGYILDTLDTPAGVKASLGIFTQHIDIIWKKVHLAKKYKIRRTSANSDTVVFTTTDGDTLYRDSVKSSVIYYYSVSALDTLENASRPSIPVPGFVKKVMPPTNVQVSDTGNSPCITVSWDSVPHTVLYHIYRSESPESTFIETGTTTLTSFCDYAEALKTWYYKITAETDYGVQSESTNYSSGKRDVLSAPINVTASKGEFATHVQIKWSPLYGAASYKIYRAATTLGPFLFIGQTKTAGYNDSTIVTNSYYRVSAVDQFQKEGLLTSAVTGFAGNISAPVNVIASRNNASKIIISWGKVNNADQYIVYRSPSQSGSVIAIDTIPDTSFVDSISKAGYYRVAAVYHSRIGVISVISYGTVLSPPDNIQIASLNAGIELTWNAVEGATLYKIYSSANNQTFTLIDNAKLPKFVDPVTSSTGRYYKIASDNNTGTSALSQTYYHYFLNSPTLTASIDSGRCLLSWNRISGATSYAIYTYTSTDLPYIVQTTSVDTSIKLDFTVSDTYNFFVKASYNSYLSENSNIASCIYTAKPLPPINFTLLAKVGQIRLSWRPNTAGEKPTSYIIHRSLYSSSGYSPIDTVSDTVFTDIVPPGTMYYYKVLAGSSSGISLPSGYQYASSLSLSAPQLFSVSQGLYGSHIAIRWSKVNEASAYIVKRSSSGSSGTYIPVDTCTDTTAIDTSCIAGTIYYYQITAISGSLQSNPSSYLSGKRLSSPSGIYSSSNPKFIYLYWSSIAEALKYNVYRSSTENGQYVFRASVIGTSYNDTVNTADTFYYRVTSVNLSESPFNSYFLKTTLGKPAAPSMITASQGSLNNAIRIMWSNTIGAKSYKLYRASTTSFTDPVLVATTTDTVYIDSVFTDSKQYYKVKSINPAGESVLSSYASGIRLPSIAPMAVSNFNVYSYTTALSLSWSISAASTYYDGFKIYRSTSLAGTYVLIDSTTSTSYYDYTSESFPTYYYYYVTAYNARGESTPSSKISGSRQ